MSWPLVVGVGAGGVAVGLFLDRLADEVARRHPKARRSEALAGRRPAVVVATAGLFAGCAAAFGPHPRLAVAAFYCAALVVLSAVDLEQFIVPNRIVLPAAAIVLAAQSAIDPSVEWLIAALAASGFFLLMALLYPAGMGMGDVKFALLLGAMLGKAVLIGIAVGVFASIVPTVVILARYGAAGRKMGIPFAPLLALGGAVALFVGRTLLRHYLRIG